MDRIKLHKWQRVDIDDFENLQNNIQNLEREIYKIIQNQGVIRGFDIQQLNNNSIRIKGGIIFFNNIIIRRRDWETYTKDFIFNNDGIYYIAVSHIFTETSFKEKIFWNAEITSEQIASDFCGSPQPELLIDDYNFQILIDNSDTSLFYLYKIQVSGGNIISIQDLRNKSFLYQSKETWYNLPSLQQEETNKSLIDVINEIREVILQLQGKQDCINSNFQNAYKTDFWTKKPKLTIGEHQFAFDRAITNEARKMKICINDTGFNFQYWNGFQYECIANLNYNQGLYLKNDLNSQNATIRNNLYICNDTTIYNNTYINNCLQVGNISYQNNIQTFNNQNLYLKSSNKFTFDFQNKVSEDINIQFVSNYNFHQSQNFIGLLTNTSTDFIFLGTQYVSNDNVNLYLIWGDNPDDCFIIGYKQSNIQNIQNQAYFIPNSWLCVLTCIKTPFTCSDTICSQFICSDCISVNNLSLNCNLIVDELYFRNRIQSVTGNIWFDNLSGCGYIQNDFTIGGNLYVCGTITCLNINNLYIKDNIITLNQGYDENSLGTNYVSGIEIDRGFGLDKPQILWCGTGRFTFRKGTNEYLNILDNGNIGIGITNPSAKLTVQGQIIGRKDVNDNTQGGIFLNFDRDLSQYYGRMVLCQEYGKTSGEGIFYLSYPTSTNPNPVQFFTGRDGISNIWRIWSSNNYNIMTINDIGCVWIRNNLNVGGGIIWANTICTQFAIWVCAADFLLGWSSRRGSPGRALVDATNTLVVNYGPDWTCTRIGGEVYVDGNIISGANIYGNNIYANCICAYGAYFAGNVGIGTNNPVQKLHVEGNVYVNGRIGIGTTNPSATLDVVGDVSILGGSMKFDCSWLPNPSYLGRIYCTRASIQVYPGYTDNSISIYTAGGCKTALVVDGPIISLDVYSPGFSFCSFYGAGIFDIIGPSCLAQIWGITRNFAQLCVYGTCSGCTFIATNGVMYASNFISSSSASLKSNIVDMFINYELYEKLLDVPIKRFVWKDSNKEDWGLIAEEVRDMGLTDISDGNGIDMGKVSLYQLIILRQHRDCICKLEECICKLEERLKRGE